MHGRCAAALDGVAQERDGMMDKKDACPTAKEKSRADAAGNMSRNDADGQPTAIEHGATDAWPASTRRGTDAAVIHPRLGADHALDQCARHAGDDRLGLGNLQRLAAVRRSRSRGSITLGGWLAGALLWHFAAMWLLVVNGLVYVALGLVTGRFRRKLVADPAGRGDAPTPRPRSPASSRTTISRSTTPCRSCSMLGVILAGVVIVLSGLAIWKPVQLQELTALFGGYDAARYVHFFAMAAIVGFLVVHVRLALLVPKSLRAMITGR